MASALTAESRAFAADPSGTRVTAWSVPALAPGDVLVAARGSAIGAFPGAEVAGVVVEAGVASIDWVGRRVVVPRVLPCGECAACRRGRSGACPARRQRGEVATHVVAPARALLVVAPPLDPGLPTWQLAALADAAATPYGAIVRAQLAPGDLCVVIGGGVRGCCAVQIARQKGAHVAIVDGDEGHRRRARAHGAAFALDAATMDGADARRALTADLGAAELADAPWKVIETTATRAGRRRAVELVAAGGTAALLDGGEEGDGLVPLDELASGEGIVLGAAACHPDLFPELMALLVRRELVIESLVSRWPFSALGEVLAERRRGRLATLPILAPDDE